MALSISLAVVAHLKRRRRKNHFKGQHLPLTDFNLCKACTGKALFRSIAEIFTLLLLMLTVICTLGVEVQLLTTKANAGTEI
jgi:hypothetical protein